LATLKERKLTNFVQSTNIRSVNTTTTQNGTVGDTITFTVYGRFSYSGHTTSNCSYSITSQGSGSGNVTAVYVVTPTSSGAYSFAVSSAGKTATLSGTFAGTGGGNNHPITRSLQATSGSVSNVTVNVNLGDYLTITLHGLQQITMSAVNCEFEYLDGPNFEYGSMGSSTAMTDIVKLTPIDGRGWQLSASSGGGGRSVFMSGSVTLQAGDLYGFEQNDSGGDKVMDSLTFNKTFTLYEKDLQVGLAPPSVGTNTYDYSLPGVTDQDDLERNYAFVRTDSAFNIFTGSPSHSIRYLSPGTVRFTWNGTCTNIFGNPTTCSNLHSVTNTFDVYALGKDLS
jgi:hypothetical protein